MRAGAGGGRSPSARGRGAGWGPNLPISRTIKTTFKFFSPALMSFIKSGGSLTPSILRQVRLRWAKLPTLRGQGAKPGEGEQPGAGLVTRGQKRLGKGRGDQPWRHQAKRKEKKNKTAHKFQNQKGDALRTPSGRRANKGADGRRLG